jgi:hydroxypyruvate isomerase
MFYLVNCSILFTELPLPERPAAARAAGFDAVEFWWPFDSAVPSPADAAGFVAAIEDAGVHLVSLNFPAGSLSAGERGLVSWPGRAEEFRAGVDAAVSLGRRLGVRVFNALYGNRRPGPAQDALAADNLAYAAAAAADIGATVLLEPISGVPAYPLRTAADVIAVLDRCGLDNLQLLADLYHLAVNGDDVDAVIATHLDRVGHVQIADAPGRHQPGTGTLPIRSWLDSLTAAGYPGAVSLEYAPDGPSATSLGWLAAADRAATRPGS